LFIQNSVDVHVEWRQGALNGHHFPVLKINGGYDTLLNNECPTTPSLMRAQCAGKPLLLAFE